MANFEVKFKRVVTDPKNGKEKEVKESFLVEGKEMFGEAEAEVLAYFNDAEILSVSKTKIVEVLNYPSGEEKMHLRVFKAVLASTFIDDDGEEKETKYPVVLWASNLDDAFIKVKEHIRQGYDDISINSITKTNLKEII